MLDLEVKTSIQILPPQLANQIAAGEVIERPASVIKELLENAIDAGANRIQIDLRAAGMEKIQITDNGAGIAADELRLAVAQHATSKIKSLDDLIHINSLGFRGEALASISSVSEWKIISRQQDADEAFQLCFDNIKTITASNHEVGTTLIIENLFYNTPARKKFLKAEQTELRHCMGIIKNIALSHFDIAFYVSHNGKEVYRFPVAHDEQVKSRRLQKIFGEPFTKQSSYFSMQHRQLGLSGWLATADYHRQQTDQQVFFVNGRVIRDRVISHAIRLAYQDIIPQGRQAAYILYLEIPAQDVDVNVHPTKHEVRFTEPRMVHDFLRASIKQHLYSSESLINIPFNEVAESASSYGWSANAQTSAWSDNENTSEHIKLLSIQNEKYFLFERDENLFILDANKAYMTWSCLQWHEAINNNELKSKPLLIPRRMQVTDMQMQTLQKHEKQIIDLGFDITELSPTEIMIRALPVYITCIETVLLIEILFLNLNDGFSFNRMGVALSQQSLNFDDELKQTLLRLILESNQSVLEHVYAVNQTCIEDWMKNSKGCTHD